MSYGIPNTCMLCISIHYVYQCILIADDIVITSRTAQAMIDTFVKLKNVSLKYRLIVNVHKTKYMKCTRRQEQLTPINDENKEIDKLKHSNTLGPLLT